MKVSIDREFGDMLLLVIRSPLSTPSAPDTSNSNH